MFKNIVRKQVIKTLNGMVNFNGQEIKAKIEGENISFNGVIFKPEEGIDIIKTEGKKALKGKKYTITLDDGTQTKTISYTGEDILKLVSML